MMKYQELEPRPGRALERPRRVPRPRARRLRVPAGVNCAANWACALRSRPARPSPLTAGWWRRSCATPAAWSGAGRIRRLLYVGDTAMNDGGAFRSLCDAGDWPGLCFIGRDAPAEPPRAELRDSICTATLSALKGFADTLQRLGSRWTKEPPW